MPARDVDAGPTPGPDPSTGSGPAPDPAPAPERFRRSTAIAVFWQGSMLCGGSYWRGTIARLEARDVWILERLEAWTSATEAASLEPPAGWAPVGVVDLERLAGAGLLARASDPDEARAARFCEHWKTWGFATRAFHASSRRIDYTETNEQSRQAMQAMLGEGVPPPPPVKRYEGARRIVLPREGPPLSMPLEGVLASRRTWRTLTGERVPLRRLAKLLLVSFGAVCEADAGPYGRLLLKTSPSGGARHPTEAYLVALSVQGLDPGIYHYDPRGHALDELRNDSEDGGEALAAEVNDWLANQYWFAGTGAVVFLTAIPSRLWFKYKHGRGYRVMLLDQGHLGQTFVLAATALGLGAWQTAAFKDEAVERALGIDGIEETALYVLGAGIAPLPVLYPEARVTLWGDRPPKPIDFPEP